MYRENGNLTESQLLTAATSSNFSIGSSANHRMKHPTANTIPYINVSYGIHFEISLIQYHFCSARIFSNDKKRKQFGPTANKYSIVNHQRQHRVHQSSFRYTRPQQITLHLVIKDCSFPSCPNQGINILRLSSYLVIKGTEVLYKYKSNIHFRYDTTSTVAMPTGSQL